MHVTSKASLQKPKPNRPRFEYLREVASCLIVVEAPWIQTHPAEVVLTLSDWMACQRDRNTCMHILDRRQWAYIEVFRASYFGKIVGLNQDSYFDKLWVYIKVFRASYFGKIVGLYRGVSSQLL